MDACGVCFGDNELLDSCGQCNASSVLDECGVCFGQNLQRDTCGVCFGNWSSCLDCTGTAFGAKTLSPCSVCAEPPHAPCAARSQSSETLSKMVLIPLAAAGSFVCCIALAALAAMSIRMLKRRTRKRRAVLPVHASAATRAGLPRGQVAFAHWLLTNQLLAAEINAQLLVNNMCAEIVRRCLTSTRGSPCFVRPNGGLAVFETPIDAALFAAQMQEELMLAPWPDFVLNHPLCEPVSRNSVGPLAAPKSASDLTADVFSGSTSDDPAGAPGTRRATLTAQPNDLGPSQLLANGVRCTVGLSATVPGEDVEPSLHPQTFEVCYDTRQAHLAAEFMDLAVRGQILTDNHFVRRLASETNWHSMSRSVRGAIASLQPHWRCFAWARMGLKSGPPVRLWELSPGRLLERNFGIKKLVRKAADVHIPQLRDLAWLKTNAELLSVLDSAEQDGLSSVAGL